MRFALKLRSRPAPEWRPRYSNPLLLIGAVDSIEAAEEFVAATGGVDVDGVVSAAVEQFRYRYEHFERRGPAWVPLSADPRVSYALEEAGVDLMVLVRAERAYLSGLAREV